MLFDSLSASVSGKPEATAPSLEELARPRTEQLVANTVLLETWKRGKANSLSTLEIAFSAKARTRRNTVQFRSRYRYGIFSQTIRKRVQVYDILSPRSPGALVQDRSNK